MSGPVSVRGGADGVEAHYDGMTAAARLFGRAAGSTGEAALALHSYLAHPDVVASTVLDPGGAAQFAARLLAALDGPNGITWLAARCTVVDVRLRAAAAAYIAADRLDQRITPEVDALLHAPAAVADGAAAFGRGDPTAALQRLLTDDPELADLAMGATAGVLAGGSLSNGTRLLSRAFDDGSPQVTSLGDDAAADTAGPPRTLRDVVAGLARRDLGQPGEIDVRLLDGADGRRRVIVDVPGTKDWSLAGRNSDVTSLVTNMRAIAGEVTTYERGIVDALHRAGVQPDDDVLLVGHSEGGMVAVDAARHLVASGEFHVSHVVTAGAPIGLVAGGVPSNVDVLAIENEGDVVPHLDDAPNPDRVNVTTVTVHHDHGAILPNHDVGASYVPGAADIDASDDPSLRAYLAGLGGYLTATTVHTRRYLINRSYP
jgi:hypothetical protein